MVSFKCGGADDDDDDDDAGRADQAGTVSVRRQARVVRLCCTQQAGQKTAVELVCGVGGT